MTRKKLTLIAEFFYLTLGTVLLTAGVYFFKIPNGFSTGGVSGIATIFGKLFKNLYLTPGSIITILNVSLLIVGFFLVGKSFGIKTVYSSLLFSGLSMILEKFIPLEAPVTDQPFLELVYAIVLTALGSAILFNCSASSGGTDIVAMILKKYTSLDTGKALLCTDFIIAFSSFFVFNIETGLFSMMGLFAKAFVIDSVIENMNLCKYFTIVTDKPKEIADFIMNELHHGVTEVDAVGGFTNTEKTVLLTVCRRTEGVRLRKYAKEVDPKSFIIVANTSEIIGRGFRAI